MASTSLSIPQVKYDVFLSFRGEDTRNNFTSHLHTALCRKNIQTFIDYELTRGDEVSTSIFNAIEESKISIIIFSEGYASSSWCLEELVKILERKSMYGQIVIPVFYHVDPSDLKNQIGKFVEVFSKRGKCFKDKVYKWKNALSEAANLSGWVLDAIKLESIIVEEIAQDVLKRLNHLSPNENKDLVGMKSRMEEVESLLCTGLKDVRIVGIWGIGGIGKTTLAHAIFNKILSQFDSSQFLYVGEESKHGSIRLQQNFLSRILEDNHCILDSIFSKDRLYRKKVLIVFDDVVSATQIEKFTTNFKYFGLGSRMIITTRNKQVLNNCSVSMNTIYEIKGLHRKEALELFNLHAFKNKIAMVEYVKLSNKIVEYAKGLPLALKVLGSSLFAKGQEFWKSQVNKLEIALHHDILEVLKVSYDGLDINQKNIFLDIACLFEWEKIDVVTKILEACDFFPRSEIEVLIDKCLIAISEKNNVTMHDLLQEMGREIVRQESIKDPGRRSRLWNHNDVHLTLAKNTGTKTIQGIRLNMSKIKEINLNYDAFAKMRNLRFFDFCCSYTPLELNSSDLFFHCSCNKGNSNKVHASQSLTLPSIDLTYFRWHGYPLKSLPSKFHPNNLVAFVMPYNNVEQLWTGIQNLDNLTHINLSYSKHLTRIPDLSLAPNLENLILEGCTSLIEIPSSIQYLNKLVILNLRDCKSLGSLPSSIHSKSLKEVFLSGCSILKTSPTFPCSMNGLYLDGTAIREFPSIGQPSKSTILNLENCSRLKTFPGNFCELKSLKILILSGCSKLERLPDKFGNLEALEELEAEETAIREIPLSITRLTKLSRLSFQSYKSQGLMGSVLPSLSGLSALTFLYLVDSAITKLPESLGKLYCLEQLYLSDNNFERIPASIKDLSKLDFLCLSGCKRLQFLPELPGARYIDASSCESMEEFSDPFPSNSLYWKPEINLANCLKLSQTELGDKMKDCLLKIQKNGNKVETQEFHQCVSRCICFPGNEIPGWFSFQTRGSSMVIELPPNWNNKNFLGFAMCAVVEFRDHIATDDFFIYCHCKTMSKDDDQIEDRCGHLSAWTLDNFETLTIQLDHVFLGYDLSMRSPTTFVWSTSDDENGELSYNNQAYINFTAYGGTWSYEVKKCGIHFLYAHDCAEPIKFCRSFDSDDEEEVEKQETQYKRLKFSH